MGTRRNLEHDGLVASLGILAGELLVALQAGPVLGHPGPGRHPHPLELACKLLAPAAFLLLLKGQPGLFLLEPGGVVAFPGNPWPRSSSRIHLATLSRK